MQSDIYNRWCCSKAASCESVASTRDQVWTWQGPNRRWLTFNYSESLGKTIGCHPSQYLKIYCESPRIPSQWMDEYPNSSTSNWSQLWTDRGTVCCVPIAISDVNSTQWTSQKPAPLISQGWVPLKTAWLWLSEHILLNKKQPQISWQILEQQKQPSHRCLVAENIELGTLLISGWLLSNYMWVFLKIELPPNHQVY